MPSNGPPPSTTYFAIARACAYCGRDRTREGDERIVRESQAHWYSDAYGVVAGMTIGDERLKAHAALCRIAARLTRKRRKAKA